MAWGHLLLEGCRKLCCHLPGFPHVLIMPATTSFLA